MASRSLFAANFSRNPRRGRAYPCPRSTAPSSPSSGPLSPLSAARQWCAANPIDRSDPVRRRAIEQRHAREKDNHYMPYSIEYIAHNQPDLDFGIPPPYVPVQPIAPAPVVQPAAPVVAPAQPNAVAQQALPAQPIVPAQPAAPAAPVVAVQPAVPAVTVQQAAPAAAPAAAPHNRIRLNGVPMTHVRLRRSVSPQQLHQMTTRHRRNHTAAAQSPPELSLEQYHAISDSTMGSLLWQLEEIESERDDMEVEEAAGVIKVTITDVGTYIINKQPPNKQIWLSSPISGPKRFDYREVGADGGKWVSNRDDSLLVRILNDELEMSMVVEGEGKKWVGGRYE